MVHHLLEFQFYTNLIYLKWLVKTCHLDKLDRVIIIYLIY